MGMNRFTARQIVARDLRANGDGDATPATADRVTRDGTITADNLAQMARDYGTDSKTIEAYRALLPE